MPKFVESEENGPRQVCVIAVCTFRRPLLLAALIEKLNTQNFPKHEVDIRILIVDNDIDRSAEAVFNDGRNAFDNARIDYMAVQPQGLVVARNAALDYAKSLDAVVVFIDDDESPSDGWLGAHWRMHLNFPDDVIAGPVVPRFETEPPSWCQDGSYWMRPTFEDASLLPKPTGDGNILFPRSLVRSWRYSPKYNTSGGQDTHLLRGWIEAGNRLRWNARAVVTEIVPPGRLTFRYALDRAYFSSLTYVWVDREFGSSAAWTLVRIGRRIALGTLDYAIAFVRHDPWLWHRARLHFSSARGTFHGLKLSSFDRYSDYQIDASSKTSI